jgi:hypothetical protein
VGGWGRLGLLLGFVGLPLNRLVVLWLIVKVVFRESRHL